MQIHARASFGHERVIARDHDGPQRRVVRDTSERHGSVPWSVCTNPPLPRRTGARWFEAPAQPVQGLYFPGYGPADAAPDLGDSAITETAGLGGFSMAAAPAIAQFVGGTPADAVAHSRRMYEITATTNPAFTIPALDFGPAPALVDIRRVVDTGIVPVINTGIAHRRAGVGQIGAGITTAPAACFSAALTALAAELTPGLLP